MLKTLLEKGEKDIEEIFEPVLDDICPDCNINHKVVMFDILNWHNQQMKLAYELGREEIINNIPYEKIHQLPDDAGSPHETEHDMGWNDYRKELLLMLKVK